MREPSDDEEGFIASEVEIKTRLTHKQPKPRMAMTEDRKFQPHSRGYMTKEPSEAYSVAEQLLLLHQGDQSPKRESLPLGQPIHPYSHYCQGDFTLIYTRSKDTEVMSEGRQFIKRTIDLKDIEERSDKVRVLRPFQESYHDRLTFDSRFESGNLHCAYKANGKDEYHLFMENDTNTTGYNQWFYFSIRGAQPALMYTIKLVNFKKVLMPFKNGYKPVIFSRKRAKLRGCGWYRDGEHLNFQETNIRPSDKYRLYVLSFQIAFEHPDDFLMIAMSLPYSYSQMVKSIKEIQNIAKKEDSVSFSLESVARSICYNQIPEITLTANRSQQKKKIIVILARQHPGETWSSFMVENMMRFLIGKSPEAKFLLEQFIFKIYPMINVDGVIYGNFRSDVSGVDLNRRWKNPSRIFHPQIYEIKKRVSEFSKIGVEIVLDLHGHSKKCNIFCYACKHNQYTCRILPYIVQEQNKIFHFPSCTFGLTRDKDSTARAVLSKIIKSENVLTVEISFYGFKDGKTVSIFQPKHIAGMADSILKAVRSFKDKKSKKAAEVENTIRENYLEFVEYDEENANQSGSQSDPEADQISFKVKIQTIFSKKHDSEYKNFVREFDSVQLHHNNIQFEDIKKQTIAQIPMSVEIETQIQSSRDINPNKKKPQKMNFIREKVKNSKMRIKEKVTTSMIDKCIQPQLVISEGYYRMNSPLKVPDSVRERKKPAISTKEPTLKNNSLTQKYDMSRELEPNGSKSTDFRIENFINKFSKYIPNSVSAKGQMQLEIIEESLSHENPMDQLKALMENKRMLEMERIRRSVAQSTLCVERQGKIRSLTARKDQVIDFKRFKGIEKGKMHSLRQADTIKPNRYEE